MFERSENMRVLLRSAFFVRCQGQDSSLFRALMGSAVESWRLNDGKIPKFYVRSPTLVRWYLLK